jgi:hypothetical protein
MHVVFTRTGARDYEVIAVRDDRVRLKIPNFDRPDWLPHDLAHYIVEFNLGLAQGFWGRVANGALYKGTVILEGRQAAHAATRSQTVHKQAPEGGTEAEVLVASLVEIAQQELETNWSAVQSLFGDTFASYPVSRPPLRAHEVQHVCQEIRRFQQQWRDLAVGESLIVVWPLADNRKN